MQLVGEFVNAPQTVAIDALACRLERNSVQAAGRVDLVPVPANIGILERHMIGLCRFPLVATASRIKPDAKSEELRQPSNAGGNSARLVGRQSAVCKAPAGLVQIVTAIDAGKGKAVRVAHDKAILA